MERYPPTADPSLTVLSAADDLLIDWAREHCPAGDPVLVMHDRFGAVALSLPPPVRFVATFHSQEEALRRNAVGVLPEVLSLFDAAVPVRSALLRVPKSLDLFEAYVSQLAAAAQPATVAAAGFMTRYFTPRLLEIAGRYAGRVEQSRAKRKARLLFLSDFHRPAAAGTRVPRRQLSYQGVAYEQYAGVFSADHIDYATQFLLQRWDCAELAGLPPPTDILDLACGNGIIGDQLLRRYPEARLTATDDSRLAVESARLNLPGDRARVLYDHTLNDLPTDSQDLVVTNPPFHFGHETNIEISLGLFTQVKRVLRAGGNLIIVANRHLNYASQLSRLYRVSVVAENEKFIVYRCR